jgi:hypothetical protein
VLAGLADRSEPRLSQVERGERDVDSHAVRRPRPTNGTPSAADSFADQPMPMPSVNCPGQDIEHRSLLGADHRIVLRTQQNARRQPDCRGHSGSKAQAEQRIQPACRDRHGNPAVVRVRVA